MFRTPLAPYLAVGAGLFLFRNIWVAVLLYQIVLLTASLFSGKRCRVGRWRGAIVLLFSAISVGLGIAFYFLAHWVWQAGDAGRHLAALGLRAEYYAFFLLYFVLTVPFLEECYWRVVVASPARGVVATDLWFAGYHLMVLALFVKVLFLPLALVVLVGASWFWRRMVDRCEGVAVAVVTHVVIDAALVGAAFLSLSGS